MIESRSGEMRGIAVVPRTGGKRAASASMRPEATAAQNEKGPQHAAAFAIHPSVAGQTKRAQGPPFESTLSGRFRSRRRLDGELERSPFGRTQHLTAPPPDRLAAALTLCVAGSTGSP